MANKVLARFSSPSVDRSVQMKYTAVYRYVYETVPYLDVFYHKLEYLSLIESNGRQRFPIAKSNLWIVCYIEKNNFHVAKRWTTKRTGGLEQLQRY